MVKCSDSEFKVPGTEEKFKKLDQKESLFCINPKQKDVHIVGDFESDNYSFIRFKFFKCQNKPECKDIKIVNSVLETSYFAMYYSDSIVTPKNYTHPYQFNMKNGFYYTSSDYDKEVQCYMKNNYIRSDVGFIQTEMVDERSTNLNVCTENVIFVFFWFFF